MIDNCHTPIVKTFEPLVVTDDKYIATELSVIAIGGSNSKERRVKRHTIAI
jgi:general stress protein CsbA